MLRANGRTTAAARQVRPRPKWLQALGDEEVPEFVDVAGKWYRRVELFKHDSWAATALYEDAAGAALVCKFNRQQSLFGFPMGWLGRRLAQHEGRMLARLSDLPNVPDLAGAVSVEGRVWPNAIARAFIPGHPLGKQEWVDDEFFPKLRRLLDEMQRRQLAYVDLHKRENVIVSDDGEPFLIDYQISVALPGWWPLSALLRLLQRSDDFHLSKHWATNRPDQCGFGSDELRKRVPWWIKLHRLVAKPFRDCRRRLLVLLKVRAGRGRVETEHFAEDAVRNARLHTAQRDWRRDSASAHGPSVMHEPGLTYEGRAET